MCVAGLREGTCRGWRGCPRPGIEHVDNDLRVGPALTAITTTSAVAASAVAAIMLLTSFIVWAAPGFSLTKMGRPSVSRTPRTAANSGRGPDTISANVPSVAPWTLTGQSSIATPRSASCSEIRCAVGIPTVDMSTKRLTCDPPITPSFPVATSKDACGDGRLANTVPARFATSLGDDALCAQRRRLVQSRRRQSHTRTLGGRRRPTGRPWETPCAQANESDVHRVTTESDQPLGRSIRRLLNSVSFARRVSSSMSPTSGCMTALLIAPDNIATWIRLSSSPPSSSTR